MELTPKQQASEALKAAETILVTAGRQPTTDQTAAVLALALVLRKLGKKTTALLSDRPNANLDHLQLNQIDRNFSGLRDFVLKVDLSKTEVDKLKYDIADGKLNINITPFKGGFAPSDVTFAYGDYHYDVIVVLGVPTKSRIDKAFDQVPQMLTNVPIVNIDFHRSNESYGAINLIEPTASSLCEILVSLSESLQNGVIDEPIATALLTGVMASTDRFTAQHTTPKALTVGAQLMAAGAKQQQVVKSLYKRRDDRSSQPKNQPRQQPQETAQQPRQEVMSPQPAEPVSQPSAAEPTPITEPVQTEPHPIAEDGSGSLLAEQPLYDTEASYINQTWS